MNLTIDNFDGAGVRVYTSWIDPESVKITRWLNQPERMVCTLLLESAETVVPAAGARVILQRNDGHTLFTGYLRSAPPFEFLGWTQTAPAYRLKLIADSDEVLLNRERMPPRTTFIQKEVGTILSQLVTDCGGGFDTSEINAIETVPQFSTTPQLNWVEHAQRLALRTRSVYRAHDSAISLVAAGGVTHALNESNEGLSPAALKLTRPERLLNDVTVLGRVEPRSYVKDYFIGDGLTLNFSLSHRPFVRRTGTIMEEEFRGATLAGTRWSKVDPTGAFSVSAGRLNLQGGPVSDGQAHVTFVEQIEAGGSLNLQHGELELSAASDGVIGGLYNGAVLRENCFAGFRIAPSGENSTIQTLINGAGAGVAITTAPGRRYALSTRIYASQAFRRAQIFHSSVATAGSPIGGQNVASGARIVLEVHEIDPANPGTLGAASVILYDGSLNDIPAFCTYALVNAGDLHGSISFVRMLRLVDTEVRSTVPAQSPRTRLVGSIAEGAECAITSSGALQFFSPFVPVPNETIVARYRSGGRSIARKVDAASVAAQAGLNDNGVRVGILRLLQPAARSSTDCENAATVILQDATQPAWSGEYQCWCDFLPGGATSDPLPGDAVLVNIPSQEADFTSVLREVEIEVRDLHDDHSYYRLKFSNDAAESLSVQLEDGYLAEPLENVVAGAQFIADLPDAAITAITSTTISVDAAAAPALGGGIEVRRTDYGWGGENDRNLIGRFTTQTFTLPRLARIQTYYLRQFNDAGTYSRYSTALHINYPF